MLALTQPGEAPLAALPGGHRAVRWPPAAPLALIGLVLVRRTGMVKLLRIGVPAAGIACLVLLPWWVRNWLVLGVFVPLTTSSGVGLWIGNNPGTTGNWMAPPTSLRGLPEIEYSRQASAIARDWIAAHPLDFVRLTFAKLVQSCGVDQFGLVRLHAMHPAPPAWIAAMLLPLSHGAHLLMLDGAAVAARVRVDRALSTILLLVAACGLQVALVGVWFEFGERHREFATPFLLLICATAAPIGQRAGSSGSRQRFAGGNTASTSPLIPGP